MNRSLDVGVATAVLSADNPAIQGFQARLSPYQVGDNIPVMGLHGLISRPLPGAQMVVLFRGGDPSNAVIIAHNDQRYHLQGLPDGTVGLAHHLGANVLFFADHIQVEANGNPVVINNAADVTVRSSTKVRVEAPIFECTGEIIAMCDGNAVHLSTHKNSGVQTGGGQSGAPVPNT